MIKKFLSIVFFSICSIHSFAQGIQFEHSEWASVLEKAKSENKMIFVDVYTSWCVPCKRMDASVFPLKEVGETYNTEFVNYKIDAEKGEGITLAAKYEIQSYPTYIFVSPDGDLIYKELGSMSAAEFLKMANTALTSFKRSKPMAYYEEIYNKNKTNAKALFDLIDARTKLKMDNNDLLNDYVALLNPNVYNKDAVDLIISNKLFILLNSNAYKYLSGLTNYFSEAQVTDFEYLKKVAVEKNYNLAMRSNNKDLLSLVIEQKNLKNLLNAPYQTEDDVWLAFYSYNKRMDEYQQQAASSLKKLSDIGKQLDSGKLNDTLRISDKIYFATPLQKRFVAERIIKIAKVALSDIENVSFLKQTIHSTELAMKIDNNLSYHDVYANLLYKTGNKKEAILTLKNAIAQSKIEKLTQVLKLSLTKIQENN